MPLFVTLVSFFLVFLFSQYELLFLLNLRYLQMFLSDFIFQPFIIFFSSYNFLYYGSDSGFYQDVGYQQINCIKIEYNYNYRTFFSQTYLHAAYNKHVKPYKNILSTDKLFGDYNSRMLGKSKKHARALKHTKLFMLLYSHTLECFAFNEKLVNGSTLLIYFKRHHIYSALEMFYASIYLGMIYFLSFTYTRMIEDSSLNYRETEEIDEGNAQNHWYYYREDRRGVFEPSIEDNTELDFAYSQHPVEWDDNGHFYRWEMHFFIFLFSFLICWGISQSSASMFFYDNLIDLHFIGWPTTFFFIFVFWRIFFFVQIFSYFSRFNIRKSLQVRFFLPIFIKIILLFKHVYEYIIPFIFLFLKTLKFNSFSGFSGVTISKNLIYSSKILSLKKIILFFYRYIYSAFQKNLNFFEKRNKYDFVLSSNLVLFFNSRLAFDNANFFSSDRFTKNVYNVTNSYVDNYFYNNGFYFPKNMYLTTNKIFFPFFNIIPTIFPFYLDFFNINDMPIWGGDFFFNQSQAVFSNSESYESWFLSNRYNEVLNKIVYFGRSNKFKKNNYFFF